MNCDTLGELFDGLDIDGDGTLRYVDIAGR